MIFALEGDFDSFSYLAGVMLLSMDDSYFLGVPLKSFTKLV